MNKLLIFTPTNPTRPFADYLNILHDANVKENIANCSTGWKIKYVKVGVYYPDSRQQSGVHRGIHVIEEFNKIYEKFKNRYEYISKWDDDILLPEKTIGNILHLLDKNPEAIGAGLFSSQYGAANILMAEQESQGFQGAFQRFYVYRMKNWGTVNIYHDGVSGDPDQQYQEQLKGKKLQLHIPHLHLDHRACFGHDDLYRVFLDFAYWSYYR